MSTRCLASLLTAVLLLAGGSELPAQQAGWRVSFTSNIQGPDDVNSVTFLTRHVGWAVGSIAAPRETPIYRTQDGGRNWERLTLFDGAEHPGTFYHVRFADAGHGWIAGFDKLLRTTDGGETWLPVDAPERGFGVIKSILTLGTHGLAVGASGSRFHVTADGGATWRSTRLPTRYDWDVQGLAFLPPQTFFAVTNSAAGSQGCGMYRSDDGGGAWEEVLPTPTCLLAIAFHDERRGVAVGRDLAFWTDDGGATWTRALAAGTRNAVAFIDATTLVSVGARPHVLLSRNGGRTWAGAPASPVMMGPQGSMDLNDIAVVDGGWWFAAGDHEPRVYHYTDPNFIAPIAEGTIPLPNGVKAPGGVMLPPGAYRIALGHRGHNHALTLKLIQAAKGVAIGVRAKAKLAPNEYACDPCEAAFPVEAEYEIEEGAPEEAGGQAEPAESSRLRLSLEPTATGVALVIDAALRPPRGLGFALAALGPPVDAEVDARARLEQTKETKKQGGGVFGALKKAAGGDLKGAAASVGVNPRASADRVKAARASPPAVYRVKVRYPFELIKTPSATEN